MFRLSILAILFVGLAFLAAQAQEPKKADDAKKALESLHGEWKIVSIVKDGVPGPADQVRKMSATISGNKLTVKRPGGERVQTISVNPNTTPASIDLVADPKKEGDQLIEGIWKLEKDTLTLCYGRGGDPRPKDFKSGEGVAVTVLERIKK
jgi:uncharacterized protein (TIGR03067 family)